MVLDNVAMMPPAVLVVTSLLLHTAALPVQTKFPPVQVLPPGETGRRVTDDGLVANYFPAARKGPAVLMLPGSLGGLPPEMNNQAKVLQAEGFSVLYLSYFRAPGQNLRLELIPLEYFDTALSWLARQPEVDANRIGIFGGSKGAEAALLVATRHPELKAVIAAMPSSVVWTGVVWGGSNTPIDSSWSEGGKALPHLPHTPFDSGTAATMADNYAASLKLLPQHPEAAIPVEKITAPLLLVCGEADRTWPSCPMARQIEERLRSRQRPAPIVLAYPNAGHAVIGSPLPPDDPRLTAAGGTPEGAAAARADSWPKAVAFLKTHLFP